MSSWQLLSSYIYFKRNKPKIYICIYTYVYIAHAVLCKDAQTSPLHQMFENGIAK